MASVAKRKWTHKGVTKEGWEVRYFDEKGVRRSKTLPLKKDADAFKRKVEREIEDGTHTADADAGTVEEVARLFVDFYDQKVRDGRVGQTRYDLVESVVRRYIVPALGRKRMRDLTLQDVEAFYVAQCKVVQPQTAKSHCYMLKLMEDFARKRGFLKTRPVADALGELQGVKAPPVRVPTAEEMRYLLDKLQEHRPYHRDRSHDMLLVMVRLAVMCGLRQGEILGLTLANIDFERGIIRVRHSRTRHDVIKGPKSAAGVRDVALTPQATEALRRWLDRHFVANDRGLVFRSSTGNQIHTQTFHKPWKAFLEWAGFGPQAAGKSLRFHALRHFHASYLQHRGMAPADVARQLGHAKYDTTLGTYSHSVLSPAHQIGQARAIMTQVADAL